jgi:transposase
MAMFYDCRGNARNEHAPRAAIWFDKSHLIRLSGSALDDVRNSGRPKIAMSIIQ